MTHILHTSDTRAVIFSYVAGKSLPVWAEIITGTKAEIIAEVYRRAISTQSESTAQRLHPAKLAEDARRTAATLPKSDKLRQELLNNAKHHEAAAALLKEEEDAHAAIQAAADNRHIAEALQISEPAADEADSEAEELDQEVADAYQAVEDAKALQNAQ